MSFDDLTLDLLSRDETIEVSDDEQIIVFASRKQQTCVNNSNPCYPQPQMSVLEDGSCGIRRDSMLSLKYSIQFSLSIEFSR